jgi:protein-tyrosine phosphatase
VTSNQTSMLFVCLGNICRSPAAECFFRAVVEEAHVAEDYVIDSAGTGNWHVGAKPDRRMRAAAKKQGLNIYGSARQVTVGDLSTFDWIFCMDKDNLDEILAMGANPDRAKLFLPFIGHETLDEVPDPYYGGDEGFENVITLIRDATQALISSMELR